MSDQISEQRQHGLFSVAQQANTAAASPPQNKALLAGYRQQAVPKRRTTFAYLLDELQEKTVHIPETFESVDRSLPMPPAPKILQKALGSCFAYFLDFSEISNAVQDSRENLLESICNLADENQRVACAKAMADFESRFIHENPENSLNEINQTYNHLSCLLNAEATERSLPWQSRLLACSHFLFHLAKPETVCQGSKIGTQVLCLIHKLVSNQPARLAEMLCWAAITGEWQTFDGKTMIINEHSLKPGPEEILFVPGSNSRSYAVKILQCLLLNNCIRRRRQSMTYTESPGRPGRYRSGQIIKSSEGEMINPRIGANISHLELALLALHEFNEKSCVIVNTASFSPASPEYADFARQKLLLHINSADELAQALTEANKSKSLPVVLAVDEKRLLAETYHEGINHTINIVSFNDRGLCMIFNPNLLPGMQRLARIDLQKLYRATVSSLTS